MADHGYDASEEGSVDDFPEVMVKIYPLVMLTIHQPHFLATCTNSSQKMEVSCFDASTHLSPHNYFITCGGHRVPLPLDYQVTYWSPTQFNSVAFYYSQGSLLVVCFQNKQSYFRSVVFNIMRLVKDKLEDLNVSLGHILYE